METTEINAAIIRTKEMRVELDRTLQVLKNLTPSRERALAVTKVQEAIMWLGMDLKRLNELQPTPAPGPYPSSYDPSTPKVEPTADGLKL